MVTHWIVKMSSFFIMGKTIHLPLVIFFTSDDGGKIIFKEGKRIAKLQTEILMNGRPPGSMEVGRPLCTNLLILD